MRIRIRDLREDRDVKQCDLAEAIGINQQTISNYETGKTIPDAFVLIKIADFFGVSIDYLLGRVDMDLYNEKRRTALIENIQRELEELKLMKYPQPLETKQSI
ncbi:MAG: helix-turn-helix domain-containing protein [Clostridia bacterium]|nr:helix-turn-helix domain-containing protein [Clostridia bacterium]